jgi:hypothetical protein
MRGKSIGLADRPVVPAVPRFLGSPWTVWRPRRPCGSRPLDRSSEGPWHWPHTSYRADLARCSPLGDKAPWAPVGPWPPPGNVGPIGRTVTPRCPIDLDAPICPMDPEGAWKGDGSNYSHGPLAPLGPPPPTYLRIHRPEGRRGRAAIVHHSWGVGSRPESHSDPPFTLKVSIDKLR